MEVMGKTSIASVLKIIMDALWYLSFAGLVLVGLLMVAGAFASPSQIPSAPSLDRVWGTMTVPVVFELEEGSYEIRADALGIEAAKMGQALSVLSFNVPTGKYGCPMRLRSTACRRRRNSSNFGSHGLERTC